MTGVYSVRVSSKDPALERFLYTIYIYIYIYTSLPALTLNLTPASLAPYLSLSRGHEFLTESAFFLGPG
jgi:hypothetical protein